MRKLYFVLILAVVLALTSCTFNERPVRVVVWHMTCGDALFEGNIVNHTSVLGTNISSYTYPELTQVILPEGTCFGKPIGSADCFWSEKDETYELVCRDFVSIATILP